MSQSKLALTSFCCVCSALSLSLILAKKQFNFSAIILGSLDVPSSVRMISLGIAPYQIVKLRIDFSYSEPFAVIVTQRNVNIYHPILVTYRISNLQIKIYQRALKLGQNQWLLNYQKFLITIVNKTIIRLVRGNRIDRGNQCRKG